MIFPKGFKAGGAHSGIAKGKNKKDIAIFYSETPAQSAGMFTDNVVKAAPVLVSEKHLKLMPHFRAVVANSGCANACTGQQGMYDAEMMCEIAGGILSFDPAETLVASTGVIGRTLPMKKVEAGISSLAHLIKSGNNSPGNAAEAILTTDTVAKVASRKINIGKSSVTIWGCAKGSGMIHPSLGLPHATMLAFILTDAHITREMIEKSLESAVSKSFNCVTVDGDTSTNDSIFLLANGASGASLIDRPGKNYSAFASALQDLCLELAKKIAKDGEGATRFVEIEVKGCGDDAGAKKIASTIATSPLVKTAIFGSDANWGRILAAAGRAGVPFSPDKTDITIGGLSVFEKGKPKAFSETAAKKILNKKEVSVTVNLNEGKGSAKYYTCDLSLDYIRINANYRS